MSKIIAISGKALSAAINAYGKAFKTMAEKQHVLAFSSLSHAADHGDPVYVNALYAATPTNYRPALRAYFGEFGRFSMKAGVFAVSKTSKRNWNLEGAEANSPADLVRTKRPVTAKKSLEERFLKLATNKIADKTLSDEDKAFYQRMKNWLEANARVNAARELAAKPAKTINRTRKPKASKATIIAAAANANSNQVSAH